MREFNIKPFRGWVLNNFPFIEADFDALTTYEQICKLTGYVNEVAKNQKELNNIYEELYNGYKDLYNYVNEYLQDIDNVKEDIKEIKNSIIEINNAIATLNANYTQLRVDLNTVAQNAHDYTDSKIEDLENEIQNLQIGSINVYDPTIGEILPLQEVINNLYGMTNKDGLTATEFDALELTATAFDAYEITAYEFDNQGKVILV